MSKYEVLSAVYIFLLTIDCCAVVASIQRRRHVLSGVFIAGAVVVSLKLLTLEMSQHAQVVVEVCTR